MKNVAVIPARGGSKRILRKNIRKFCGKPMIAWPITIAKDSGLFSKILVSTDDEEIAEISIAQGADVPFLRPKTLARDDTPTEPVIKHALTWLKKNNFNFENVCCIYATAAFMTSVDLKSGKDLVKNNPNQFVYPVTQYDYPLTRALKLNVNGSVKMADTNFFKTRSQENEDYFHDAGQFYWANSKLWLSNKIIFESEGKPIFLERFRVHDIDTEDDWIHAEQVFQYLQNH